jgi:hypothetical protein
MFDIDHSLFGENATVLHVIEINQGVSPAYATVTIRDKIRWVNRCGALKSLDSAFRWQRYHQGCDADYEARGTQVTPATSVHCLLTGGWSLGS